MSARSKWSTTALACAAVSVLTLTSAVAVTPDNAVETVSYQPIQAIGHVLGSKRAVGYFTSEDGECHLLLMVAEAVDPEFTTPLSAARLRVALRPGQLVTLDSDERRYLELTCGPDAKVLVGHSGSLQVETN